MDDSSSGRILSAGRPSSGSDENGCQALHVETVEMERGKSNEADQSCTKVTAEIFQQNQFGGASSPELRERERVRDERKLRLAAPPPILPIFSGGRRKKGMKKRKKKKKSWEKVNLIGRRMETPPPTETTNGAGGGGGGGGGIGANSIDSFLSSFCQTIAN